MIDSRRYDLGHCFARFVFCAVLGGVLVLSLHMPSMAQPPDVATGPQREPLQESPRERLQEAMCSPRQITEARLAQLRNAGYTGIALEMRADSDERRQREQQAIQRIRAAGFQLAYWIEVGRNRQLATAHPQWMASVQGHTEWRRLFRDPPRSGPQEVVKVFPWVPVGYREAFQAHRDRIADMLSGLPAADRIYLNDLQGAPSACGCGNPLCRWTTDYGPRRTAESLGDDAAARFLAAVKSLAPETEVVPVWVTECEEHDGRPEGWCAGVGCFRGICWKAYTRQLTPVAEQCATIGVLATLRELGRHKTRDPRPSGWIAEAVRSFQRMPPQHGGTAVPARRLVVVLQGWDVEPEDMQRRRRQMRELGVRGTVTALTRIDQSWEPKVVRVEKTVPGG